MSTRALMLGLVVGLFVASFTYFNDWMIRQTQAIGSYLPLVVFGVFLLLVFGNGLLCAVNRRLMLRGDELAVALAVALVACAWPGNNYGRDIGTAIGAPNHWHQSSPHWLTANVMSYVPGASGRIGAGHVQDWPVLLEQVAAARSTGTPVIGAQLWSATNESGRRAFERYAGVDRLDAVAVGDLVVAVNEALENPAFFTPELAASVSLPARAEALVEARSAGELSAYDRVHLHRALLVASMPEAVLPPPRGDGVLLAGGRRDIDRYDEYVTGDPSSNLFSPGHVNWGAWWPSLRLWAGASLLMGLSALCMALIVHLQWSRRELLPYPIVRFAHDIFDRPPGAVLPAVVRNRLFWVGLCSLLTLHLINGSSSWFDQVPSIPLNFGFNPLRELFPNASQVAMSHAYFNPRLIPTVIAFSFFIPTAASFSLGISQMLFMMLGAVLLSYGVGLEYNQSHANKGNMMRFGAYVGMALMILYTGRYFYGQVAAGALALWRSKEVPAYAVWAARGLVFCVVGAIGMLMTGGMELWLATLCVLIVLMSVLVMSRMVCETGVFVLSAPYLPVAVMMGLFGFEALGPTGFILLAIASWMFIGDPRDTAMPFISTALQLGDRYRVSPTRLALPFAGMTVIGLAAATVATISVEHRYGILNLPAWRARGSTNTGLDHLALHHREAEASQMIADATAATGLDRLALFNPMPGAYTWLLFGLLLVFATSFLRLRFQRWPLHPIAFLIWGTWIIGQFAFSFLVGWLVKVAVVRLSGTHGYKAVKPLMIGIIAGELLGGFFWLSTGTIYYFTTGMMPVRYAIFPPY